MTAQCTKFSEVAHKNFLALQAVTKRSLTVAEKHPDSGPFHRDSEGRELITPDRLHELIRETDTEKAVLKHGGNPNKRLDLGGFPKHGRRFMATYNYKSVSTALGFSGNWDWQYLYGGKGSGKTTFACRQALEWMKEDITRQATYLSLADWINSLKSADREQEIILPKLGKFVVIDDIDKFYDTEWQILQIYRLVDYLYRLKTRVIFTSNLSLRDVLVISKHQIMETTIDRI